MLMAKYCEECPLKNEPKTTAFYKPDLLHKYARIIILTDYARTKEELRPFGKILLKDEHSAFNLMEMLKIMGVSLTYNSGILWASAIYCNVENIIDNPSLLKKAYTCCKNTLDMYLIKQKTTIASFKPLILGLGDLVVKQRLGQKYTLNSVRHKIIDTELAYYFFIPHPTTFRKNMQLNVLTADKNELKLIQDLKYLFRFIKNGYKVPDLLDGVSYKLGTKEDIEKIKNADVVCLDLETEGLDFEKHKIVCCSFSINKNESFVFFDHKLIKEILSLEKKWVLHYKPFDEQMIYYHYGIKLKHTVNDTAVLQHLINENSELGLEHLTYHYLGKSGLKDLAKGKRGSITELSQQDIINYCGADTDNTLQIYNILKEKICENKRLLRYYVNFVQPVTQMLTNITLQGMPVDLQKLQFNENKALELLNNLHEECLSLVPQKIKEKHKEALSLTRDEFLRDILFSKDGFNLTPVKEYLTLKQKKPQVNEKHLMYFIEHPFVKPYLRWAKLHKILTTYLQPLHNFIKKDKIHPVFRMLTVTGRTSCVDPPLQQYPQRNEWVYLIKECISAPEGWVLGVRDLSQSEIKIMGWLANDRNILKALENNIDLHTYTASIVNNIPIEQVTKEMRQKAKPVNFGFLYGMQANSFQKYVKEEYGLNLTLEECIEARNKFFSKPNGYWGLPIFYQKIQREVEQTSQVVGVLGRIRRFPEYKNLLKYQQEACIRQAINFPVQNFSSDLALLGMYLFYKEIDPNKAQVLCFIHDAIMIMAKEDYIEEALTLLKDCMCYRTKEYIKKYFNIEIGYPITSDAKIGKNWNELKEIK